MQTHQVTNQVPPLVDYNVADYPVLREALERGEASESLDELLEVGRLAGSAECQELGRLAERNPPELKTHDRYGNRIDEVIYDAAYHELMRKAVAFGLHGAAWADLRPHAHLLRAAKFSVWHVVDAGHGCPISMTYAAVPALRADPELAATYEPLLASLVYDPSRRAPLQKKGLIAGMSMTEKQGGSDVRANTTRAEPQSGGTYRLVGHKWFTSAPNSDLFLTLAQAPGGLTCFVVPRVLTDGSLNAIRLQRLKDKLGNRSNASGEIEYEGAVAGRLGDEGHGVRTIIEMVNGTRLDCTISTATLMMHGTMQAAHHVLYRSAFGRKLVDQPLMQNVVADLAVEAEASMTVALWLAQLTDSALAGDQRAARLRRLGLAVSKYYVCKRGPVHAAEALECLGGNGYVEESGMPRIYREAPLLSIWEGSGNVAALDALRAIRKDPETLGTFLEELTAGEGGDRRFDAFKRRLADRLKNTEALEYRARRTVEDLALALQGSLLVRFGHPAVADAFMATRLDGDSGTVLGTLPAGIDVLPILERATPRFDV